MSGPASMAKPKTDGESSDIRMLKHICSRWSLSATREGFSEERVSFLGPRRCAVSPNTSFICCAGANAAL